MPPKQKQNNPTVKGTTSLPPPPPPSHTVRPTLTPEEGQRRSSRQVVTSTALDRALGFMSGHAKSVIGVHMEDMVNTLNLDKSTKSDFDNSKNEDRSIVNEESIDSKEEKAQSIEQEGDSIERRGDVRPQEKSNAVQIQDVNFNESEQDRTNDSSNDQDQTETKASQINSAKSTTSKASASTEGSISIGDMVVDHEHTSLANTSASGSMTDGLTVMEKLKLAAKLDSATENMFLKELLETSIHDLEAANKKKRKTSNSGRKRSGGTPRTPSSQGSRSNRKHEKKKKMHRSRSSGDKRESSRRKSSRHSHSRSERSLLSRKGSDKSFQSTQTDLSLASGMSATSTTAAVPGMVYRDIFSRIRGGEPLPREDVVNGIVRGLFSAGENGNVVALVPSNIDKNSRGIGKTTLAGLVCCHPDVRAHYHKAIAWVDLRGRDGGRSRPLDYDRYCTALHGILSQCGISSRRLQLGSFITTPREDAALADIRMKIQMKEVRDAMGKILSSSRNFPTKRKSGDDDDERGILIILDDLVNESDLEWFVFRYNGDKKAINDVLVTSTDEVNGAMSVAVLPLSEEESVKLVLMEANLQSNSQVSKSTELREIVKSSLFHPLTLKYVGRWLNLKRTTSNKGFDDILDEIRISLSYASTSATPVDVLYEILDQAITPMVKGKKANTIRLCFASLRAVFSQDFCNPSIPLEVVNEFFSSVLESKGDVLSEDGLLPCPLFRSHGRHASKLVPEIFGALGIFNITKHSTKEKSIQIDHEVVRQFGDHVAKDETMQQVLNEVSLKQWHESYAKAYFDQYNWNDPRPDRPQTYALRYLPRHMIEAELFGPAGEILSEKAFVRGRMSTFGLEEGTRIQLQDVEAFCTKFHSQEGYSNTVLKVCEVLESVLMSKLDKDAVGSAKGSLILDAGRCLQMIGATLVQVLIRDDVAKYCDKCVELVYGSKANDLVASLLYNTATLYLEVNRFESAREIMDLVVAMRGKLFGDYSVLVARSLCLLGDIFFEESDYESAESEYKKSISILKAASRDSHLDSALIHFKLGLTDYERGYCDDSLKHFDQSFKFAENSGLPTNHGYFINIYYQTGIALLKIGKTSDAAYAFKQGLTRSKEVQNKTHDLIVRVYLIGAALYKINGKHTETVENYRGARMVLRQHNPSNAKMIARVNLLMGAELDNESAIEMFRESIELMKQTVGGHLDIADALVNLSYLEHTTGKHEKAAHHLEEATLIQRAKIGSCVKLAVNLTNLGGYFRAAGDNDKALDAYTSALLILTGMKGYKEELIQALLGLADLLNDTGEYKAALGHYNDCLRIQKSLYTEPHENVATTLYSIGVVKMNQGQYVEALEFLDKAVDVMSALKGVINPFNGDAYNLMGFVEMKSGKADNAMKRFTSALQVWRALGRRIQEAVTLKNIGHVHREKSEHDLALEQYEDCLCIITEEEGKSSEAVVDVLISMGNVTNDMNMYDDAISHYKNALQKLLLIHQPEMHESVASLLEKMGMMQFHAGNVDSALVYLKKSVETYRQLGGVHGTKVIPALFVIGNIHNILKDTLDAEEAWRDAYEVFGSIKNDPARPLYPEIKGSLAELLNHRRRHVC